MPYENYKQAGAVIRQSGIQALVTNIGTPLTLRYYLRHFHHELLRVLPAKALDQLFCTTSTPAGLRRARSAVDSADTSCLRARGAVRLRFPSAADR